MGEAPAECRALEVVRVRRCAGACTNPAIDGKLCQRPHWKVMNKIRVGVLFGGRSGEHEVSLLSAASVLDAIDKSKYDVVPIGITKDGRWLTAEHAERLLKGGAGKKSAAALGAQDNATGE